MYHQKSKVGRYSHLLTHAWWCNNLGWFVWQMVALELTWTKKVASDKEGAGPPLPSPPSSPLPRIVVERIPEVDPRRSYVLSADIEAHGRTGGCPGCPALASHGKATIPHNNECRERNRTIIQRTLTGKARMNAFKDETEGDLLSSEVGVLKKDTEEDQRSIGQDMAPPQKRRAVIRVESAETQDYVSAHPLTSCMEQKMEAEDEKDMEELSFVPSAVREPRWTLHMCDCQCGEEGFEFFETAAIATEHAINLCKQCYNIRRVKEGEEEVTGSKWRALVEQEAFRGKLWAAFGMEQFVCENVGTSHH